jgi:hypothetical protein
MSIRERSRSGWLQSSTGVAVGLPGLGRYHPVMSTSPLSPADIRAAAEVHAELGPEYRDAVVESFLAKIDNEIAARIDARLPTTPLTQKLGTDPVTAARRRGLATGLVSGLAVGTIATGVPLTLLVTYSAKHDSHVSALQTPMALIWAVIAIIYGAGATAVLLGNRRRRQSTGRRQRNGDMPDSSPDGRVTRVIPGHSSRGRPVSRRRQDQEL